jgi:hypothetical protein
LHHRQKFRLFPFAILPPLSCQTKLRGQENISLTGLFILSFQEKQIKKEKEKTATQNSTKRKLQHKKKLSSSSET